MLVLLKKELRSFFASATGYIVIAVFLLVTGLFLWVFPGEYNILESGYAQTDGLFALAPWLYLFLVPAVTMRSFAEEKRNGTIEMLYTKPLSSLDIVLGKYLAGVVLVLFSLLPTIIYYISIAGFAIHISVGDFFFHWQIIDGLAEPVGNVDSGAFWGSFIGLAFLAAAYVAIGLFASSVTDNQIVSFILAMALCFVFYSGFDLTGSLFSSGSVNAAISAFGINAHYESMSRGVIDSRDVLYFLGITAFFLFLVRQMIVRR